MEPRNTSGNRLHLLDDACHATVVLDPLESKVALFVVEKNTVTLALLLPSPLIVRPMSLGPTFMAAATWLTALIPLLGDGSVQDVAN